MADEERDPGPGSTQPPGSSGTSGLSADSSAGSSGTEGDGAPPSTPFDHPYFLPVLLFVFAAWFGYDGWFNPDMEWLKFNRYGFGILLALAVYFTWKAVKEKRDASGPE